MARQDGIDYLLRALHLLGQELKRSDFYCVIIGKGSALRDLRNLAKHLNLEDRVWFTGFIPEADKLRYLATADICIDPDPSNKFNDRCTMIKMMEYMAMGKPIVAFDLPEHRVTADAAALYAHPNDELDFARKIAILMDDCEMRKEMGRVGRERIEKELAWNHQEAYLINAYETVLKMKQ
jgi:glycosyltransferase involved in cell wall biosynthesis